jgi:uncharacterized protein YndB with AHSA1/START domain
MTETLLHTLDRRVLIAAPRELVFRYFTDSERWARWWGKGSTIDPRPEGRVHIVHPNGVEMGGRVVSIDPPQMLVFTYGYKSGTPIPEGGSLVTIRLDEREDGTELNLSHAFADISMRDQHVQGWRYQLAVFANVVAREAHAGVGALADRYFAVWAEADPGRRAAELRAIAEEAVVFRDPYSCTTGIEDLNAHIEASRRFMPGIVLARTGEPLQCQGLALVSWTVKAADGAERAKGTNVFELGKDGRIARVTGLWA